MSSAPRDFDTIVVGAGPAGSAAAAVLARAGWRVALLEKEAFPRYRVGESLIPYCWFSLERLGLVEKLDGSAFTVKKHSVQFVDLSGTRSAPFYFHEHTDHDCARTWQVVRSEFDQMLVDNAVQEGAQLFTRTRARELVREGDAVVGIEASDPDGPVHLRAPITIDASGRDLFSVRQNDWRVPEAGLDKVALWTYYRGALRDPGIDEGATTIAYLPDKGWFWYIPLPDDTVSVGIVADRETLRRTPDLDDAALFARAVEQQPWIRDHLAGAEAVGEHRRTGDYSYRARHCAAPGLVLAGDAFAFLDPVFSSGVFLALQTGILAGDAVAAALEARDYGAHRFEEYGAHARLGLEAMRRLVHAFYDRGFSFGHFLKTHPEMNEPLTDCLIGNVCADLEPLFEALAEFAAIPAPAEHGRPLPP